MAVVSGGAGLPNASKEVYEFALGAACSDGKMWPEEQFKLAERLDPENSEVDRRKYQEILLRLGGLTRDQFLADDPVRRGISCPHSFSCCALLIANSQELHPQRITRALSCSTKTE